MSRFAELQGFGSPALGVVRTRVYVAGLLDVAFAPLAAEPGLGV
jgi:hypothetical protein